MAMSSSSSYPQGVGGSVVSAGTVTQLGESQLPDIEMCFLAKISNARILTSILTGIHLKKDQVKKMRRSRTPRACSFSLSVV